MDIKTHIDEYTLKARVIPTIIALFPYLYVIHSAEMNTPALFNSLLVNSLIILLLTHVLQELGKAKQKKLFSLWGGNPATILLRHRDTTLPTTIKRQYHQILGAICGQKLPSEGFESANPNEADELYNNCVQCLVEATYDKDKFPLLWQQSISYGFWRNMLALRTIAISVSVLAFLITVGAFLLAQAGYYRIDIRMLLTPIVCGFTIWGWLKWVKINSVKLAAFEYAQVLLAESAKFSEDKA